MKHIEKSCIGLKRKEANGCYFCIPTKTQFPIFMNTTLFTIYELSDSHTSQYVIEELSKMYPNRRDDIKKDVVQSLWYLYNIGLITRPDIEKEERKQDLNAVNELRILDEPDFEKAEKFIQELLCENKRDSIYHIPAELEKTSIDSLLELFSIPKLRLDHVMGKQKLFQLYRPEIESMEAIVGVSVNPFGKTVEIVSLFAKNKECLEEVVSLLSHYFKTLNLEMIKLKLTESDRDKDVMKCLMEFQFYNEAVLESEAISGDLIIVSKKLKQQEESNVL